jgi:hypothetical protein
LTRALLSSPRSSTVSVAPNLRASCQRDRNTGFLRVWPLRLGGSQLQ